jgi:GNAT superfamily N-acetyltransferase
VNEQSATVCDITPTCVITFQEEAFSAVLPELQVHWQAHYEETQREHDTMPLDVDLASYQFMEAQGELSVVTMRADEALVGYFVSFLHTHLKSQTVLCAYVDAYYIAPAYRGRGAGAALFRHAEGVLKARGVQRLFGDTKVWHNIGSIFRRHGWREVGVQYTKWIGD